MALQFSTALRNTLLDAIETDISTTPKLRIYESTGTPPADPDTAINGTMLVEIDLPSDWMAAASSGSKGIAGGPWIQVDAAAAGTADYFRIWDAAGTTCFIQGTVGQGSGDLSLDNTTIAVDQQVSITTFTLTDGNP